MSNKVQIIPAAQHGGDASFLSSVFNLMNAILGSGIVGLPFALLNIGYFGFFVALVIVAALAMFAIDLLLKICEQEQTTSYETISERAFGRYGKMYTSGAIYFHCMIAMCSFIFLVKYEGPPFIQGLVSVADTCGTDVAGPWYTNSSTLVILVIWLVVAPLAFARHIDFLGYTSGIGMACMVLFTGLIMAYKFILTCPIVKDPHAEQFIADFAKAAAENSTCDITKQFTEHAIHFHNTTVLKEEQTCEAVALTWNSQSVYAIPTMLFAFQCHASCLPVYAELKVPNRANMLRVASTSIAAVWTIYSLVSFFSYFTFYNVTMQEVLMMYSALNPSDSMILMARGCSLICVIFSAPLLHYPCRKAQVQMFWGEHAEFSWPRHVILALVNLAVVTLVVLYVPDIKPLFGYGGAITANSLVLILPSLFYYKLIASKKGNEGDKLRIICPSLAGMGVVIMILSVYLQAKDQMSSAQGH